MADFDILYFSIDNNPKSRAGLEALYEAGYNLLVLAYEIPLLRLDPKRPREIYIKPRWYRRRWLRDHCVANYCHARKIPYFLVQETDSDVLLPVLEELEFDYLLVNGWPTRISAEIAALGRIAAMNCHSSLLPRYRGGNITYGPLINREKTSGLTVHVLTEQLDQGAIIAQKEFDLDSNESIKTLTYKRAKLTGNLLLEALDNIRSQSPYQENPPSPFWKRQSRLSYLCYQFINKARQWVGMELLRRNPEPVRFIDRI